MQAQNSKIDPAARAAYFAQATRQNWQMLPAVAGADSATIQVSIPKVRLLSKIRLLVTATLTAQHAGNVTYVPAPFAPYNYLRNVRLEINNGFAPFNLSGRDLYFYNLVRGDAAGLTPAVAGRGKVIQGLTSSPAPGTANVVRFLVDLPVTLNDRDPVGLMLLQNEETTVTLTVDFNTMNALAPAAAGYTFATTAVTVIPMIETFSIPAVKEATPDLSILKLVHSKTETVTGAGVHTLTLPTGQTYRKLLIYIADAAGGEADGDIAGNFELVLNQADIPFLIRPSVLAAINHEQFNTVLPQGLWVFDFSYQGLSGYGGSRDWIDTERLTEFWFRFNAAAAGSITAVYETLSKLRTA